MPASRILALVVSTSLVAGCAVRPDYLRPDAPLAEQHTGQHCQLRFWPSALGC